MLVALKTLAVELYLSGSKLHPFSTLGISLGHPKPRMLSIDQLPERLATGKLCSSAVPLGCFVEHLAAAQEPSWGFVHPRDHTPALPQRI
jgi:hypothetical protein